MERPVASTFFRSSLPFFMGLALLGLALSVAIHVGALLGIELFPHSVFLHFGIFVVFLPAILVFNRLNQDVPRGQIWKNALSGCPLWMRRATGFFFGYAGVNFVLFMIAVRKVPKTHYGSGHFSIADLRGFSGHWMAFYSASFAILYSALHRPPNIGEKSAISIGR